jgi:hypothetical protein
VADKHPLQPGDVTPDLSDYNFSNEADRREQETYKVKSNPMNYHGQYPAADQSRPEGGRLWKVGQAMPNEFLSAPFSVIQMDGDNNGMPAEVHELNIREYGDAYDPTSPLRVRTVAPAESHWDFDSDGDGYRN